MLGLRDKDDSKSSDYISFNLTIFLHFWLLARASWEIKLVFNSKKGEKQILQDSESVDCCQLKEEKY